MKCLDYYGVTSDVGEKYDHNGSTPQISLTTLESIIKILEAEFPHVTGLSPQNMTAFLKWIANEHTLKEPTAEEAMKLAIFRWINNLNQELRKYYGDHPAIKPPFVKNSRPGKKYIRVFAQTDTGNISAICFINKLTGDIYDVLTWTAPNSNKIVGNVSTDTFESCGLTVDCLWREKKRHPRTI